MVLKIKRNINRMPLLPLSYNYTVPSVVWYIWSYEERSHIEKRKPTYMLMDDKFEKSLKRLLTIGIVNHILTIKILIGF